MSILIRGMEMPKRCIDCPFMVSRDNDDCILQSDEANAKFNSWDDMKASCPLVEIPTPHGRLGDLDALYAEISNGNKAYNGIEGYDGEYPNIANVDDCLDAIKYADTVIEAEGSET